MTAWQDGDVVVVKGWEWPWYRDSAKSDDGKVWRSSVPFSMLTYAEIDGMEPILVHPPERCAEILPGGAG